MKLDHIHPVLLLNTQWSVGYNGVKLREGNKRKVLEYPSYTHSGVRLLMFDLWLPNLVARDLGLIPELI